MAEPGTYDIDPVHTFISFSAQHMIVGRVRGRFEKAEGVSLSLDLGGTAPPIAGKPMRIAFQARAAVRRAQFGMTRELLDEIGRESESLDVWNEIEAEPLRAA